ncbi:MAG: preprotein translocase subunit YajC [Myxococcota bacterium]
MSTEVIVLQAAASGGLMGLLVPMLLMFGVFYFLVLRPQTQEREARKSFIEGLKVGDEVVTTGGLLGTVRHVDGEVFTVEVARNTKIKVLRGNLLDPGIARRASEQAIGNIGEAKGALPADEEGDAEDQSEEVAASSGSKKRRKKKKQEEPAEQEAGGSW